MFEDDDKVAEIVSRITSKLDDVDRRVSTVQKDREREAATRQEKIVKHYHTAYRDIASDPTMHFDFNLRTREISAEEPNLSEIEVIDRAAKAVYARFSPQVQEEKTPTQSLKEKMSPRPKPASGRKPEKPAVKPKTRADTIGEMRSSRGMRPY